MICNKCGKDEVQEALFCGNCGSILEEENKKSDVNGFVNIVSKIVKNPVATIRNSEKISNLNSIILTAIVLLCNYSSMKIVDSFIFRRNELKIALIGYAISILLQSTMVFVISKGLYKKQITWKTTFNLMLIIVAIVAPINLLGCILGKSIKIGLYYIIVAIASIGSMLFMYQGIEDVTELNERDTTIVMISSMVLTIIITALFSMLLK